MFNSRKPNKSVNRIHRRSLYEQYMIMQVAHSRFLRLTKVSVFKIVNDLCPLTVKILLSFRENKYKPKIFQEIKQQKKVKTV